MATGNSNISIGMGNRADASGREYMLNRDHVMSKTVVLNSTAVDSGGDPVETNLRKGLVLGKITATGKYAQYNNSASDGTEVARGVLDFDVNMLDGNGVAQDKNTLMVIHGLVNSNSLFGSNGAGLTDMATGTNGCSILSVAA